MVQMKPSFYSTPCAATWRTTSASPGVQLQVGPNVHLHVRLECIACCHRRLPCAACMLPVTHRSSLAACTAGCHVLLGTSSEALVESPRCSI